MPSGKFDKPVVIDNHDGTVTFKYDPKEVGTHELQIKYNLEQVQGKQFDYLVNRNLLFPRLSLIALCTNIILIKNYKNKTKS